MHIYIHTHTHTHTLHILNPVTYLLGTGENIYVFLHKGNLLTENNLRRPVHRW